MLRGNDLPVDNYSLRSLRTLLLVTVLLLQHDFDQTIKIASGQTIIPFVQPPEAEIGNASVLRSFLEPCEVVTLQTECTEEEYESNEDCLPQKKDNCDRSKELFCLSGVCLPNCHPHKETYNHIEGKCFRKVGSDCKSFNVLSTTTKQPTHSSLLKIENEDNKKQEKENQHQHSTVIVPKCEKNAVCEKGQCKCVKDFTYDHNFSKCMRFASYNNHCNESITCDRKSDIVCEENQCQCKSPEIQYFHLKRKRCYILIGQVCSTGLQFCPDNSSCVRRRNKVTTGVADGNNGSINYKLFTFSTLENQNPDDSKPTIEDNPRLRLLYRELTSNQYDSSGGDEANMEDEHFIGIWGDDEKEFVCKCDKGYGPTRDKNFCLGLHGTRCNTLHRCNMERGLKCVDGVCLCSREKGNEQIFSVQFQTCITRIGASCLDGRDGREEEDICPVGGSCTNENCTCDKGLIPLSSVSSSNPLSTSFIAYSCVKSHGMSCKNNSSTVHDDTNSSISFLFPQGIDPFEPPCNHEIGLQCNTKEGKCLCRDSNQFYDVRQKICRKFYSIDAKIPVVHFTPPDDREYNFHRNASSEGSMFAKAFSIKLGFLFTLLEFLNN